MVNTASRCAFTGQYDGLQALYDRYRDRGLTVIGVPSDSFNQELASGAAVKEFCEVNFAIDFPITEITPVTGPGGASVLRLGARSGRRAAWNFHKILLDGDGRIVGDSARWSRPDVAAAGGGDRGAAAARQLTLSVRAAAPRCGRQATPRRPTARAALRSARAASRPPPGRRCRGRKVGVAEHLGDRAEELRAVAHGLGVAGLHRLGEQAVGAAQVLLVGGEHRGAAGQRRGRGRPGGGCRRRAAR